MNVISHRHLRQQTDRILERVKKGETIHIARHGEITGTLVPPSASNSTACFWLARSARPLPE
jgi:antitoxin (DNA-binding transcriptional repressor) of toxin-antitoxin stability system